VAVERKHSGGAQVVRNGPSSPLCSDPPVSVLLFFPKVFPLCFVPLASVFLFLHSARSCFPLCHCPSLFLQNFAPSGFPFFFRFCSLPVFPCSFLFPPLFFPVSAACFPLLSKKFLLFLLVFPPCIYRQPGKRFTIPCTSTGHGGRGMGLLIFVMVGGMGLLFLH